MPGGRRSDAVNVLEHGPTFARLGLELDRTQPPQESGSPVPPIPHAGLFDLPPALKLIDHQRAVAAHLDGIFPGVPARFLDAADQIAQGGNQGVVFRLVVGIAVAKLEPFQALGAVLGAGNGIAAIAEAGVALAAAVKNQQIVGLSLA